MVDIDKLLYSMSREAEEKQAQIKAKKFNLSYVSLVNYPILQDILLIIDEKLARKCSIVAYLKAGNILKLATNDPTNPEQKEVLKNLKSTTNLKPELTVCSNSSFLYGLTLYRREVKKSKDSEGIKLDEGGKKIEIKDILDLKNQLHKVSTTELLDVIFAGAAAVGSSDIHLEPEEETLTIRFRIDGVLQQITELPNKVHRALISRIKYMAKLKLDVSSIPQDGRFDAAAGAEPIDVRVSILPTAYGEAVVMRLLYRNIKFLTLDQLGFNPEQMEVIHDAISKPNGIIFNTGPTGSGKTTTLYAVLMQLNKPGVKIITLEDPIEYRIKGIDQAQVNAKAGFTFAAGLRSILRQDPDIIMVGEMRDLETAEIGIQASLTGHLVLTTLHTNSAPGAFPRLLDMGVKPYLIGGSINLVIAQRLVRKLCQKCHGKGCLGCNQTGFHGRTTIAELLIPTAEIEQLIKKESTLREFEVAAKAADMKTMMQVGLEKVRLGITTEEEIMRVTKE